MSITTYSQQIVAGVQFRQQLAGAFQLKKADLLSACRQQAKLGDIVNPGIAFSGGAPLNVKGLGSYNLVLSHPVLGGNFLLGADVIKFGDYSTSQIGVAYGLRFSESVSGGIKINFYRQAIAGYNGFNAFPVEASIMYAINNRLQTGINFYNPVSIFKKVKTTETLPVLSGMGWRYQFSESFAGGLLITKEDGGAVIFNPFFSMNFLDRFYFNPGYETGLSNWIFSAGYHLQTFTAEMNISIHPYLGWSGGLSIQWMASKKNAK